MAINKELYKKYKQMKAQGINITLAELKSQMSESKQPEIATVNNAEPNLPNQSMPQNSLSDYSGNISTCQINNDSYMNQFSPTAEIQSRIQPQPVTNTYCGNVIQAEQATVTKNNKYGLLGYPLGHSLSEHIHNAGFKSLGLDCKYELLETPPEKLVDRIKFLKAENYAGFNVTIPLKLPVTMFLDEVDTSADLIGAINTVVINPDKTMKGYNTDVFGFKNAIPSDFIIQGKTAGILGTGGAARAAISALATSGIKKIKLYTRNIPNCIDLLKFLRSKFPDIEFDAYQIASIRDLSDINILVNCTPIGMLGHAADMTPVEEAELKTLPEDALVYDVIYNPKKTKLLKLAQQNGYKTVNGMDMLIYQALKAEEIWTGSTPDFKDMKIAALENI